MATLSLIFIFIGVILLISFDSIVILKHLKGLVPLLMILFVIFDHKNALYYILLFVFAFLIVKFLSDHDKD